MFSLMHFQFIMCTETMQDNCARKEPALRLHITAAQTALAKISEFLIIRCLFIADHIFKDYLAFFTSYDKIMG